MKGYDTIQLLQQAGFPLLLDFKDIESCTGISEKTLKNWHTLGKLPFKSRKYGGSRKAHIQDVVHWMETGEGCIKKSRGRPTASEAFLKRKQSEKKL